MADLDVVPFRALTDDEAPALLASNAPVTTSNVELARLWGFNEMKVSRRLKAWERDGKIARDNVALTVITPGVTGMAVEAVSSLPVVVETAVAPGMEPRSAGRTSEPVRGSWGHRAVVYATVADRLVELQGDRARLDAESRRVTAQTGPARFLAAQLGTDAETVIRWRVALLVLLIDPSAVVLTIAASRRN